MIIALYYRLCVRKVSLPHILIYMFIKMIVQRNTDKMNFFQADNLDDAIEWLLKDN